MKEQTLSDLADLVASHLNLMPSRSEWSHAALKAAREELSTMQTPITPAALFAAGWNNDRDNRWSYRVDLLEWIIVEIVGDEARLIGAVDYYPLTGCKTMHDFNELVRLLGGVK